MEELRTRGATKLSGDYIRGYTDALLDVRELLPTLVSELKRARKRIDTKWLDVFMALLIEHRAEKRAGREGFVRWNYTEGRLEWHEP